MYIANNWPFYVLLSHIVNVSFYTSYRNVVLYRMYVDDLLLAHNEEKVIHHDDAFYLPVSCDQDP